MSSSSPAAKPEQLEFYCWPWVGIIANAQNDNRGYWLNEFSKYNPLGVEILRDGAQVVVRFGDDLSGFKNAMEFEKSFQDQGYSKKEWMDRRASPGAGVYGWFAREDDYKSDGPVGNYLCTTGGLRTISDVIDEVIENRKKIASNLVDEIDSRNENMDGMQIKYSEETRKVHSIIKRALNEQEMLNFELESKRRELDSWSEELHKRESLIENERQKIEEEKKQRETENFLATVRELERDCAEMNKMKTEIEILKMECKFEETKHLGLGDGDCDDKVQQKMDQMKELLDLLQETIGGIDTLE
ncbi:hypothetical protein ACP275_04G111000 [Erythranthe tilingii]